ncbi:MAG: SDR family oxidoreductase [Lewinellaceae bacterium]|nr:SDR family oxidoreductase [Lewinellaceae bacterium]
MRILLTGATGYIGKRLLPVLVEKGHTVVCGVRDPARFNPPPSLQPHIQVVTLDLLDKETLQNIPSDINAAYYLVHSMSSTNDYAAQEQESAIHFREAINATNAEQVIYLSGIVNDESLSKHLSSRKTVEDELSKGNYHLTTLRAGVIIGSGSASFEIVRDLVEKLPIMVAPKWLKTKCQPIGISDVIAFLSQSLLKKETYDDNFDIGGPDVLTYREMLMGFAKSRNLKRTIITVPVMTPRLSSYWLYFVTSTSYPLAVALVNSMKIEVVCRDSRLNDILGIQPIRYEEALSRAFGKIENNEIVSSWKDAQVSGVLHFAISEFINVPKFGCFKDQRQSAFDNRDACLDRLWRIGGKTGWYYADFLWRIRGMMDKLFGGVGLRRGRTSPTELHAGDALDFWRVLYADKAEGRLLLFAEMKVPGEAWLEFRIQNEELVQTATFRPRGILGRLYWYAVYPFHGFVFSGMLAGITHNNKVNAKQ